MVRLVLRQNATILAHLVHIVKLNTKMMVQDDGIDLTQNADELQAAAPSQAAPPTPSSSSVDGPRCMQVHLVRPSRQEEESPSTVCNCNIVSSDTPRVPRVVQLGRGSKTKSTSSLWSTSRSTSSADTSIWSTWRTPSRTWTQCWTSTC